MIDAVSPAVIKQLPLGKYVRWAEEMSTDTLECLLWVIGVYGTEYRAFILKTGEIPEPKFAAHQRGDFRGVGAMRHLARIFGGTFMPRENWAPALRGDANVRLFSPEYYGICAARNGLDHRAPAFTREFLARLDKADPFLRWSNVLSEVEFYCLLWLVGEYGGRGHIAIGLDPGGYSPPTFVRFTPNIERIRRCLTVMASLARWRRVDTVAIRTELLGGNLKPIDEDGIGA